MKCPSCNKFAAYDTSAEPEVDLEVDEGAEVTGTVHIVLTSECCGDELKEAHFDVDVEAKDHFPECFNPDGDEEGELKEGHEFSVDASGKITDRSETTSKRTRKDGTVVERPIPFRYQKRFFGFTGTVTVQCLCGAQADLEIEDEVQASAMDELVWAVCMEEPR